MKNLTVVILTYKTSEKIILDCIFNDPEVNVIIVENSENFIHQNLILSKFKTYKYYVQAKIWDMVLEIILE